MRTGGNAWQARGSAAGNPVFTAKQWDAQKGGGYFELLDNDNQVYAARLLESGSMVTDGGVELPLSMTEEDVKNSFGLLSQD